MEAQSQREARIVTEVRIRYHTPSDPDTEREMTLSNPGGQSIDGLIWSEALLNKLRYAAADGSGRCVAVERRPGQAGWRVRRGRRSVDEAEGVGSTDAALTAETESAGEAGTDSEAAPAGSRDCIWMHNDVCQWDMYCVPDGSGG